MCQGILTSITFLSRLLPGSLNTYIISSHPCITQTDTYISVYVHSAPLPNFPPLPTIPLSPSYICHSPSFPPPCLTAHKQRSSPLFPALNLYTNLVFLISWQALGYRFPCCLFSSLLMFTSHALSLSSLFSVCLFS